MEGNGMFTVNKQLFKEIKKSPHDVTGLLGQVSFTTTYMRTFDFEESHKYTHSLSVIRCNCLFFGIN